MLEGQLSKQLLLSKKDVSLQDVQFKYDPKHVLHLLLHFTQFPLLLNYPIGQSLINSYIFYYIIFYEKNF